MDGVPDSGGMPRILTAGLTDYWHLFEGVSNFTLGCNREFSPEMFRARRHDLPPGHPLVCSRCMNAALGSGGQLELPGIRRRMELARKEMLNAAYGAFGTGERPAFQTQDELKKGT